MSDSLKTLQSDCENLFKDLRNVDQNIAKLTGRKHSTQINNQRYNRGGFKRKHADENDFNEKRARYDNGETDEDFKPTRGHLKSTIAPEYSKKLYKDDKESEDEDIGTNSSIRSKVVTTSKSKFSKTRNDIILEQKSDKKGMDRFKRIFGSLAGKPLNEFREKEKKNNMQLVKREEIEKKLEEAQLKEREDFNNKKLQLFAARDAKQEMLKHQKEKLRIVKTFEAIEEQQKYERNFLKTKVQPHLLYLPAKHNKTTQKLLETSQKQIDEFIENRREQVRLSLDNINIEIKAIKDKQPLLPEEEAILPTMVEQLLPEKEVEKAKNSVLTLKPKGQQVKDLGMSDDEALDYEMDESLLDPNIEISY